MTAYLKRKGASLVAQMVKTLLQCNRPRYNPGVGKISWRREWLPTPIFLPGEFHGQRSLVGHSLWGHRDSNTTEQLITHAHTEASELLLSGKGWELSMIF